jgi:hypothetical protein
MGKAAASPITAAAAAVQYALESTGIIAADTNENERRLNKDVPMPSRRPVNE